MLHAATARHLLAWIAAALLLAGAVAGDAPPAGDLAELPHWPIGLPLPASVQAAHPDWKPSGKAVIMAYVPPGVQRIRGMVLIIQNTDSKEFGQHAALREVCAKRELAVVYLPFLQEIFNTQALTLADLAISLGCSLLVYLGVEVYKLAVTRASRAR